MSKTTPQSALECPTCSATTVIQIDLKLPDGTEVDFYSCHRCEARWWNQEGEPLPLDRVLELARKPRK